MFSVASITTSFLDYPSPEDHAICVYFQGCLHGCLGCHSPTLQPPPGGNGMTVPDLVDAIYQMSQTGHTTKVVLSGGDPLQQNTDDLRILLKSLAMCGFDVCIYTGFVKYTALAILGGAPFTYIKCGPFKQEIQRSSTKTDTQFILASSNQDFYNNDWTRLSDNGILDFTKE